MHSAFISYLTKVKLGKEGKLKITKSKQLIAAELAKVKVKHGAYRVFKTQGKRGKENSNNPPPHHGVTSITGVTTRRLTGGKISSPSQPYHFPAQFNSNPNQTYLNKLIKVFRINRKLQAAEFVSRYELNSAGTWTSRARAENL